ncbi:SprB repeat-containing protein, partial [uncultured Olleya sp.]|uniref:SprB repeat-containing protein n=1 Tax=uncultured Olleya sp. TaxID=757243 RepID=UPI0025945D24
LDANGCTFDQNVTITQPDAVLSASIASITDVLCNSEATGSIDISVTGGTAPYSYIWNDTNNTTTQDLNNVIAGAYNVTITDANGCTTT